MPKRDLPARVQELIDELKRTTSTAEELQRKVSDAIRADRRAGLPHAGATAPDGPRKRAQRKTR